MTAATFAAIPVRAAHPVRPKRPAASVFLPKEHGSWSLALEPLALGLLAAPSLAGSALALATAAAFFARRPLKALLARPAPSDAVALARRPAARLALLALSLCAVLGFAEAIVLGGLTALWPLLLAAPLALLFVYFDRQNDSRAAAAELAGSAAFAVLPAVLATLAGATTPAALALAAVMLARSVPTILTVRTSLRVAKGQPANLTLPVVAALTALVVITMFAVAGLLPSLAVAAVGALFVRTVWFGSPLRPAWSARRIGITEAALGILYVTFIGLACRLS